MIARDEHIRAIHVRYLFHELDENIEFIFNGIEYLVLRNLIVTNLINPVVIDIDNLIRLDEFSAIVGIHRKKVFCCNGNATRIGFLQYLRSAISSFLYSHHLLGLNHHLRKSTGRSAARAMPCQAEYRMAVCSVSDGDLAE